jgi:hypothetical protein
MDIRGVDLLLGLLLGVGLGVGLTLAVGRVRLWLGKSPTARLAAENRELKQRLKEKDRHVGRMLAETKKLAEKLGKTKPSVNIVPPDERNPGKAG